MKYIDAEKLIAEIKALKSRKGYLPFERPEITEAYQARGVQYTCDDIINIITSLQQEQPEVDYNKFEKLFDDFCESNKGHHITSHDACMWFWELGLNARKED